MKTHIKIFFIIFLPMTAFLFSIGANNANAAVSLPWSTTYNCADWSQSNGLYNVNCDGISGYGGWTTANGSQEQITSAANNTNGGGGKGQRHWLGDGRTNNSGGLKTEFATPQTELWVRWYMRYEQGFQWDTLGMNKVLYFNPDEAHAVVPQPYGYDKVNVWSYTSQNHFSASGNGWNTIMVNGGTDARGNKMSDGEWHCWEIHIKMDTNGSNGIAELWIDGTIKLSYTDVNHGTQTGWTYFVIGSNSFTPANGRDMAVDYDDFAVSATGYIGPISSSTVDTTPPSAPQGLVVQ